MDLITTTKVSLTGFFLLVPSVMTHGAMALTIDQVKGRIAAEGHVLNFEWEDQEVEGETYLNMVTSATLEHKEESMLWQGGVRLQRSFGQAAKLDYQPIFTLQYAPFETLSLTLGTLDHNHSIHEFFLRRGREFEDITEEGLQMRYKGSLFSSEFWLNWINEETATQAEKFEVGSVNNVSFSYGGGGLQLGHVHIDGQKTEDETALRNFTAMAEVYLEVKGTLSPRAGLREFYSSYQLNDAKKKMGRGWQIFLEADYSVARDSMFFFRLADFKGKDLLAEEGHLPYRLPGYRFGEVEYRCQTSDRVSFSGRVRADGFKGKLHTTQEISFGVVF